MQTTGGAFARPALFADHAESGGRRVRATAVLFAVGSLLTLVDAALTRRLLLEPGHTERWAPVRMLIDALGVDIAIAIASVLAVATMAALAWTSVYGRRNLAAIAYVTLFAAILVRGSGCLNNFGVMLG